LNRFTNPFIRYPPCQRVGSVLTKKKKKNISNILVSKNKNSLSTLPPGAVPKGAFLSLKKKTRNGTLVTFSNQKNLPSHLTHHFRVQYPRGQNLSPEDVPKEKKKREH
jgi:hypothetical protein